MARLLAGPLVSVNLLQLSLQLISIMFVGHLGELPLSGASMANSFTSVTGISLLSFGQTLALFSKFLGQDTSISDEAGHYALYFIPGVFAYDLLQCVVRFLQTQSIVIPMVLCAGITTLIHVVVC
ncbi:hypothetical protein RDI58_009179 [Solanum bulbocastanum]|uniref:Uncharacterized protein n=1 Tax=Solanum bulbocastanum TaxID=147425 RepID=A0AAN8TZP3_SOLBU